MYLRKSSVEKESHPEEAEVSHARALNTRKGRKNVPAVMFNIDYSVAICEIVIFFSYGKSCAV
jgi:hypothetical protein